ncbi:MAG TPA: hypothetical protein VFC78_24740 [Tepidisphaeraceae bacterium]|nr:hypothetical protein [Tepidisphaeraceae bacterium]
MRYIMMGAVTALLAAWAQAQPAGPASPATSHPLPTHSHSPATAPATRPSKAPTTASVSVPAITPKAALRKLNLALRDGDADAIRSVFETSDESGKNLILAMADYAHALAALHNAAIEAYGQEGANTVTGDMEAQSADGLAGIDKAQAAIDGDTALVQFAAATDPPVRLVKIHGEWKVPFSQLLNGADRADQERKLAELRAETSLARGTTAEIKAGKLKSPDKAAETWRTRLLQAVAPRASSRPAPPDS